jgi:hypothetical protein
MFQSKVFTTSETFTFNAPTDAAALDATELA